MLRAHDRHAGPVVRAAAAAAVLLVVIAGTPALAQTPDAAAPSIGAVVKEVPGDLLNFFSWDTALVLGGGGGAALIGHIWDDDLADEIETSPTLNNAMEPGHTYGGFSVQVAIGAGLYATGWFAKKDGIARTGGDILRAQLLSQAYVQALKFTVRRERPDASDRQSFPSGHSAAAFATAKAKAVVSPASAD